MHLERRPFALQYTLCCLIMQYTGTVFLSYIVTFYWVVPIKVETLSSGNNLKQFEQNEIHNFLLVSLLLIQLLKDVERERRDERDKLIQNATLLNLTTHDSENLITAAFYLITFHGRVLLS